MFNKSNFNAERNEFYSKYPDFYANYDNDTYQYGLFQTYAINQSLKKEIEKATNELWNIFMKVKDYLKVLSHEELVHLNISPKLIKYIDCDYLTYHSFLSRMDFIVDLETNKVKLIELNNETPYYMVETYQMNNNYLLHKEGIRQDNGYINNLCEAYQQVISDSKQYLNKENVRLGILGCSKEEDLEEWNVINFYYELFKNLYDNIELIHYGDLNIVKDEGVYNYEGELVDVLFHPSYPIEFLQHDTSDSNEPIGLWLLELVKDKKVALINPPTSHFVQDKTILALLWTLHEIKHGLFTDEEHKVIQEYLLPTYTNSFVLEAHHKPYVEKPIQGRRGISVNIYAGKEIYKSEDESLANEKKIYQEYMPMPKVEVIIDGKTETKSLLISAFITKGSYNGLVTVVGNPIIDNECHWLPHMIVE